MDVLYYNVLMTKEEKTLLQKPKWAVTKEPKPRQLLKVFAVMTATYTGLSVASVKWYAREMKYDLTRKEEFIPFLLKLLKRRHFIVYNDRWDKRD